MDVDVLEELLDLTFIDLELQHRKEFLELFEIDLVVLVLVDDLEHIEKRRPRFFYALVNFYSEFLHPSQCRH